MSERLEKIPKICHYIYFHIEDDKEINEAWNILTKEYGENNTDGAVCTLEPTISATISISLALGDESGVYLSCFEDLATIGLLFFSEDMNFKHVEKKRNQIEDALFSAIGEATVVVVDKKEQVKVAKENFSEYQLIESELSFGELYHFSNDRGYYFCLPSEKDPLINFLIEELPLFDASFQSLDKKVKFFQDQMKLMEEERTNTDKFVNKLLYAGIGKKETGSTQIEVLEQEIDDLSQAYEKMANYSYMVKNARNTLQEELTKVEKCLSSVEGFCLERPLESEYIETNKDFQGQLEVEEGLIINSLEGIKTAIDVVDTKVGLLRGKESLAVQKQTQNLQEEGTSMQMATSMIEFVLVFFYSLESWEILSTPEIFHLVPVPLKVGLIGAFAFMTVVATHFLAISWREHWKINKGVLISMIILVGILVSIILITQYYAHLPAAHH